MKEFALIFRMDILTKEKQPNHEQMESYIRDWGKWINWIDEQGKLAEGGRHFSRSGRVLRPGGVTSDGPYAFNKESVAGYINILAENIDEAVKIAEKSPILMGEGTSVEIREASVPGV
jgi:hypothetical protein